MVTEELVRWKSGQPRRLAIFRPLPQNSQLAFTQCVLCDERLGTEKRTQLLIVEPPHVKGSDRWHDAPVERVHESCLDGLSDGVLEMLLTDK